MILLLHFIRNLLTKFLSKRCTCWWNSYRKYHRFRGPSQWWTCLYQHSKEDIKAHHPRTTAELSALWFKDLNSQEEQQHFSSSSVCGILNCLDINGMPESMGGMLEAPRVNWTDFLMVRFEVLSLPAARPEVFCMPYIE